MVDEGKFERFVQQKVETMVLGRSFGRGRGMDRASSGEISAPGRNGGGTRQLGRAASENGEETLHGQRNSLPATSLTQRVEIPPSTIHVSHGSTDPSLTQDPPGGQSSVTENPVIPPLANALRTLLSTESHEAVAQLVAGLLVTQQQQLQSVQQTPNRIPSYHVVPDLSRNIEEFTGEDDGLRAQEWIDNLESMQRLHQWPEGYILTAAQMHLEEGARD